jgi:hypothetical protein
LYNPPVKSPRPFAADYPSGAPANAAGRLTADIDGRPLVAERVVGRRTLGGADEALTPAQLDAVVQEAIGALPEAVTPRALPRGTIGAYRIVAGPEKIERSIGVRRDLPPDVKNKIVAHETGHMIEDLAGAIPQDGLKTELKTIYNDLNNSYLAKARAQNPDVDPAKAYWGTGVTPEKTFGYAKADAPPEYMAEAIRAYLADPNYIKTVAPKTAAAIRAAVNARPTLSRIIQFNTIAGLAAMNGIDQNSLPIPRQQPPVFPQ